MATSNTAIKITSLPNIGNNIAPTTLIPVVNMAGVPTTQKANLQITGNLILAGAGTANFVPAGLANLAYSVANSYQPNITRVGNLNINTFKVTGGVNGQYIQTDGTGNLSFVSGGGSGNGVVGGANTQIQYNNAGNFGGSTGLTWNSSTGVLSTLNLSVSSGATIYGDTALTNLNVAGNLTSNNIFTDNYYYANGYPFSGANVPIANNSTPGVMALGNGFVLNSNNQVSTSNLYNTNLTQPTQHYTLNLDTNGVVHLPDQSIINGSTLRGVPGTGELNYTGITIGPNSGNPENTWMWVDASNAYIGTNYGANAHTWTFDADGNLTLPNNTFAVNYANGTPVALSAPAGNSGAAQFNWQGNFSNQGGTPGDTYSTLQFDSNGMPTLDGTAAYQQRVDYSPYMQILAPRVESTDFGIVAGPAIQITGYADNVFYNTPRSAYLSVQDQANATQQWDFGILGNGNNNFVISDRTNSNQWRFSTNGNLTLPYSSTTGNTSFTMTNIGTVAYNSASPLTSGGSLEFVGDELNHFLVVPNEARFAPGTGDFTIEWYQYVTSDGHQYPRPFSLGICCGNINSLLVGLFEGGSNNIAIQTQSGYNPFSGWNNTLNVWQHIAVVRSSGTVTIYQDGVAFNSVSIPDDIAYDPANGYFLSIGSPTVDGTTGTESINSQYIGLITNMRYVVGTAVYTSDFTPSTDPLTLIPGTELLLQVANSGTLAEALYIETITNNSSIISNGNAWTFGGDGNLTLPGNTSSINYANGQPYGGGSNANTGNVTFSDQIVIGTGDDSGGGGLYLAPGNTSTGNLQYLRVRGGDYPTHIHLDTGNNQYFDQYFGDDYKYIVLHNSGDILINTNDLVGNTAQWIFGTDGNLTAPGNIIIDNGVDGNISSTGNVNVTANSKSWSFDSNGNLNVPGNILGSANANLVIYANAGVHEFIFADNGTFYAPDNVVLGGTSISIGPGANTLTGISNAVFIASSNSTAYIQAAITNVSDIGSADWAAYGHRGDDNGGWIDMGFNSSGYSGIDYTITGPGDGSLLVETYYDGQSPGGRGGNLIIATGSQGTVNDIIFATGGFLIANEFMRISNANNALELTRAGASIAITDGVDGNIESAGNINITANSNIWTFGRDGTTRFPNDTIKSGNGIPIGILTQSGNVYTQINQYPNNWEVYSEDDTTGANSGWAWIRADLPTVDTPQVFIETQKGSDGVSHRWTFDQNGNLTLPTNTFSVNYANGTQVPLGGGNTSQISNGNSNVSIPTSNDNVYINTNNGTSKQWIFNKDGSLRTSGNVDIYGAINFPQQVSNINWSTYNIELSQYGRINTNVDFFANANVIGAQYLKGDGSNISNIAGANVSGQVGNALVAGTIYTNAQPNITSVGTLSSLSVTGNVSANNFTGNGSQLTGIPTQTTGNWELVPGVNTANISVPLNGTYSIWVKGNIPNGIVTYTATAVVTNNNVPVLGSSYGWYYAAGNALVLTSIPTQFVGTVNNISNAVVATTTANVFTFGITNNSGANAVVNWGYTKL